MSATLTPYGRELLLQAMFMPEDYTPPVALYLAYTRAAPVANADGSQLDEPTTGYARATIGALSNTNWAFTGFAEVYNLNVITFAAATSPWGLIQGWAVTDSPDTGEGNCLMVGNIVEPFQVLSGDAPYIDVAGLAVGLYD